MLAADTLGLNLSLAPGVSVKNAFLYLILASIAIEAALKRNLELQLLGIIVPYGLFIFYSIMTWLAVVLVIDYPGYSPIRTFISLKGGPVDNLIVFLAFFYGILNAKDAMWLLKAMLWVVVIGNVITVIDGLNVPDLALIHEREDGRIGGPIGEANQYAAFLALFLPAALGLALIEQGVRRYLAYIAFALTTMSFLMTVSRGGFVGVALGGVFAAFYLRAFISGKVAVSALGGIALVAVAGLAVLIAAGYADVMYDRFVGKSGEGLQTASSGRTVIWSTALERMLQQPMSLITGFGWDTYRFFPFRLAPHNGYLKIYFEVGAIGLLLVLLSFANILRTARTALHDAERNVSIVLSAFIFGLFGILVAITFVDLSGPWLFIWAYAGTVMRIAVVQTAGIEAVSVNSNRTAHDSPNGLVRKA